MDQTILGVHEPVADTADEGTGPGAGRDKYDQIVANDFLADRYRRVVIVNPELWVSLGSLYE
jgi:hypothetical protein